ncbi:zincin [Sporormia fimetaria CBS 119925]|uniref:Zincin n=1 Tax=Sporormia fimetaria CBS 119925 TaxID=1340428 RepID=A0A6A6UX95_9PLEO|nr:zincin [Sporormia fimetaria CBS 119925]
MTASDSLANFRCCTQLPGNPPTQPSGEDRLALEKSRLWPNGSKLIVNMWGQSDFVRNKVIQYANQWSRYANLTFEFLPRDAPGDSDIRISFNPGGSWSVIGTGAKGVSQSEPTMNYGWFNDESTDEEFSRTVIHEFGHAIGCVHEQASPLANIQWNKPVVYEYYMRTQGWNEAEVDGNVFQTYEPEQTLNSPWWDPTSIMQYSFPAEFTLDGKSAPWNSTMSWLDKLTVMRFYPREGIVRNTQDGIYLVNGTRGDERCSAVVYYYRFADNDGRVPDEFITVSNGDFAWWENGGEARFGAGAHVRQVVKWSLVDDAGRVPNFTQVGFAERLAYGESDWNLWNVYRDDGRVLYEKDGWKFRAMFWAF